MIFRALPCQLLCFPCLLFKHCKFKISNFKLKFKIKIFSFQRRSKDKFEEENGCMKTLQQKKEERKKKERKKELKKERKKKE